MGDDAARRKASLGKGVELLRIQIDDASVVRRRWLERDDVERLRGAEQIVPDVGHDFVHTRLEVEAVIQRHEQRREVEDGFGQIDRDNLSQLGVEGQATHRRPGADASDKSRPGISMEQSREMGERGHVAPAGHGVVGVAPAVDQQLLKGAV